MMEQPQISHKHKLEIKTKTWVKSKERKSNPPFFNSMIINKVIEAKANFFVCSQF